MAAALWDRRLLSKVTRARSQLHRVPQGRVTFGQSQGPPPTPPPGRRQKPPLGSLRRFGDELAGGAREAKSPQKRLSRSDTPRLGTRPSPGPGSFGVQPGPPPRCAAVPGRGRLVGSTILPATLPQAPGAGAPRPHAGRRRVSGPGVSGAGRRGRGRWGRCGWGAVPGAEPHVPRPAGPMGARRSERSPYMDMFWGRARTLLPLNSGGGGRSRSHSLPPAPPPASLAAPVCVSVPGDRRLSR